MTDTPNVVDLTEVHVTLGSDSQIVNVLRGVNLTIARGESVSIVGPSGAGKSTLMMVTAGLERVTSGSVRVAGVDLTTADEDALARFRGQHVGIVFQSFRLVPTMTALENVALPLELAGRADALARAKEALEHVGLGARLTHHPSELSGGEQQRVALARAVVIEPALILADEPTGNLDGATGRRIIETLFNLRSERRTTLVLVTHDQELARRCDRTVEMADGRLLASPAVARGGA
ncbi:MAG TPA: ABC transporter ATP-binding protein [Myxococcota bacterium]|nr:ABC transporter ATP-binding protein [Myxococcota bacterium]